MEDIQNIISFNLYKYITGNVRSYTEKYMKGRQRGVGLNKTNFKWVKTNYFVYQAKVNNIYSGSCINISNLLFLEKSARDTFDNLFNNNLMKPYLFFVNDKHVSWKDIEVICGNNNYLYFKDIDDIKTIDIYEFNFKIEVFYDNSFDKNRSYISFNTDGTYNNSLPNRDTINYVVDRGDEDLVTFNRYIITEGEYPNLIDNRYRIYRESLIFFSDDGFLNDEYNDLIQVNNFNTLLIRRRTGFCLATLNESQNFDEKNNFSNHFPNIEYWEEYLEKNELLDILYDSLDIDNKRELSTEEYYKDCVLQILNYNFKLLINIFNQFYNRIGKYSFKVSELRINNSKLTVHKRYNDESESNLMLYLNGKLVSKHGGLYKENLNNLEFNLKGLKDDDIITVIYYKFYNNNAVELELSRINEIVIDPKFNVENSEMYSTYIKDQEFNIFNNKNVLYNIPFKYEKCKEGIYRLYPEDEIYYNSTVELHSKDKYHHYSFKSNKDIVKIILPNEFKCCRNINKYSLFIDGRRISHSDIKLVYPTKTTPFKYTMLYTKVPIFKNSKVDVIYTPFENREIINIKNITNNIIEIEKDKLKFPIIPELYNFYINGELIDNSNIKYISNNKIFIPEDLITSKYNLTIVSLFEFDDEYINNIFNTSDDRLSTIVNSIEDEELIKLLNANVFDKEIIDDMDNIQDKITNRQILLEIVKDHWVENGIYQGIPVLYDYESGDLIEEDNIDIDGNIRLDILDASKFGKLDEI